MPAACHPKLDAADADVVLISSEGAKFQVHKKRLCAGSGMFDDMFEVGSSGAEVAEIPVAESSAVLEVVLPYCYPARTAPFPVAHPVVTDVIRALDKYDIGRGMEAVALAYESHLAKHAKDEAAVARYFWFAARFNREDLDQAVLRVIDSQLSWDKLGPAFEKAIGKDDQLAEPVRKLETLLLKRAAKIGHDCTAYVLSAVSYQLERKAFWTGRQYETAAAVTMSGADMYRAVHRALEVLSDSARCTSLAGLQQFRREHPAPEDVPELVPWGDLEATYGNLLTKLE